MNGLAAESLLGGRVAGSDCSRPLRPVHYIILGLAGLAIIALALSPEMSQVSLLAVFLSILAVLLTRNSAAVFLFAAQLAAIFLELGLGLNLSSIKGLSFMNFAMVPALLLVTVRNLKDEGTLFQENPLNSILFFLSLYCFFSMLVTYFQGHYDLRIFPGLRILKPYFPASTLPELLIEFKNFLNPFLLFLISFNLPRSRKEVNTCFLILLGFFLLSLLLSVLAFYGRADFLYYLSDTPEQGLDPYHLTGAYQPGYRLRGILQEPNVFAAFLVLFFPLMVGALLFFKKPAVRFGLLISLYFFFVVMIMTGSRGGITGVLVASAVLGLILVKRRVLSRRQAVFLVILLIGLLGAVAFFFRDVLQSNVIQRVSTGGEFDVNILSNRRLDLWKLGLQEFLRVPVFGAGWANFLFVHNNFLYILDTLGIVGLGLYWLLFSRMLGSARAGISSAAFEFKHFLNAVFLAGVCGLLAAMFFVEVLDCFHFLFLYAGLALKSRAFPEEGL